MLTTLLASYVGPKAARVLSRLIAIVAAAGVLAGVIWWQRMDAVSDYKAELRAKYAEKRIEDGENAEEIEHEIESMDDDALLDFLLSRVSRPDSVPGGAGEGCDPRAPGFRADRSVSCPQ